MLRQFPAVGTLVPEQSLVVCAVTDGRVRRIQVLPGTEVKADTVLVTLTNPELEESVRDAEWQLQAAELELIRLRSELETERFEHQAAVATLKAELHQAQLADENTRKAAESATLSTTAPQSIPTKTEELAMRYELAQSRLNASATSARVRLQLREIELQRTRSLLEFKKRQVSGLEVRAGMNGVVQQIGGTERLQEGQTVTAHTALAKIIQPARLRAEFAMAETQSWEIQIGQLALIDTRAAKVRGRVARIDPVVTVATGTVTVYVALEEKLPKGIRPGSMVEGAIEIEKLSNVLYLPRQASGGADKVVSLFKITDGGRSAIRVPVKLGRSSNTELEVLDGLQAGDEVILSDMSDAADASRIQLR